MISPGGPGDPGGPGGPPARPGKPYTKRTEQDRDIPHSTLTVSQKRESISKIAPFVQVDNQELSIDNKNYILNYS